MSRHQPVRWSVSVLAAAAAIGGCSMFHHKQNYYDSATESRPLEVPPDLETPSMSNELVVPPSSGTPAAAPAPAAAPVAAPSAAAAPVGVAPPTVALTGNGLHVADSVDHTWQRVGLALERAQVGTISARDAAGYSYTVEVSGLHAAPAAASTPTEEHHWYSFILHPFGGDSDKSAAATKADAQPVSGHLVVKVSADGDGSRVDVEGPAGDSSASEAARRVLEALRERLS